MKIDYSEQQQLFSEKFGRFTQMLQSKSRIAVLTGAGVSTLSSIPDFRGTGGVYTKKYGNLSVEDILHIDFFHEHPEIFYQWAGEVWFRLEQYEPNVVHRMVAMMEHKGLIDGVFTQNIDMLHQRAGSANVWEVHGSPMHNHCTVCGREYSYRDIVATASQGKVPRCECGGVIKPDIILYGESLDQKLLARAEEVFGYKCDLCIVLGSSLNVSPVNLLPRMAVSHGSSLVIVNAQDTSLDGYCDVRFRDLKQFSEAVIEYLGKR